MFRVTKRNFRRDSKKTLRYIRLEGNFIGKWKLKRNLEGKNATVLEETLKKRKLRVTRKLLRSNDDIFHNKYRGGST